MESGDKESKEAYERDPLDEYMTVLTAEEPQKLTTAVKRGKRFEQHPQKLGGVKSTSESEQELVRTSEEAMNTAIDKDNRGRLMLQKMGYKGGTLGPQNADVDALIEPIKVSIRDGRTGIGMENHLKREAEANALESQAKRHKIDQEFEAYRSRFTENKRLRHHEKNVDDAMVIARRLAESQDEHKGNDTNTTTDRPLPDNVKSLKEVNVLWRRLEVRERTAAEHKVLKEYGGKAELGMSTHEDPELDEFDSLDAIVRLKRLTSHLRNTHQYCFWCGHGYKDKTEMESSCPGPEEDDH